MQSKTRDEVLALFKLKGDYLCATAQIMVRGRIEYAPLTATTTYS